MSSDYQRLNSCSDSEVEDESLIQDNCANSSLINPKAQQFLLETPDGSLLVATGEEMAAKLEAKENSDENPSSDTQDQSAQEDQDQIRQRYLVDLLRNHMHLEALLFETSAYSDRRKRTFFGTLCLDIFYCLLFLAEIADVLPSNTEKRISTDQGVMLAIAVYIIILDVLGMIIVARNSVRGLTWYLSLQSVAIGAFLCLSMSPVIFTLIFIRFVVIIVSLQLRVALLKQMESDEQARDELSEIV